MPTPTARRHDRLLIIAGVVLVLSAVAAAFVIFADDTGTTDTTPGRLHVQRDGTALVLGRRTTVPHTVVVREDFGSPACRSFDIATRDFLQTDATEGLVRVEYRPEQQASAYSRTAWAQWTASSSASTALRLHSRLYDEQPATGSGQAGSLPEVSLDDTTLTGTAQQVADRLERALAQR